MDNIEFLHGSMRDPRAIVPLTDWDATSIADMFDRPAPPREWIVDGLIPDNIVGVLAAGGGTGKSFLCLQLAFAVATGRNFLGFPVSNPGNVLILNAEDDRDEIHRRVESIVTRARKDGEFDEYTERDAKERVRVLSLVGENNRITECNGNAISRTNFVDRLEAMIGEREIKLLVIDPLSRFRGGEENSNDHMTYFIEAVEQLRQRLDTTVLVVHHFNKQGLKDQHLASTALRGGSGLNDGIRFALAMATMTKDRSEAYGIHPDEARMYVRMDSVKGNYGEPWEGMWLRRAEGGVLVKADIQEVDATEWRQDRKEKAQDIAIGKVVTAITEAHARGYPHTQRTLCAMAGIDGPFNVSDKGLRALIKKAVSDGLVVEAPNQRSQGGGMVLIPVGDGGPF